MDLVRPFEIQRPILKFAGFHWRTVSTGYFLRPNIMVPGVRILALEVRFNVRSDAKMIPTVLRCFPNVETLHIKVKPLVLLLAFICIIMY
jgi:hypothetical protein